MQLLATDQAACECLLPPRGRRAKPGAQGPSRSPWQGRGNPDFAMESHAALRLRSWHLAIGLARLLLAGLRYQLRDLAAIRLRLHGAKWR